MAPSRTSTRARRGGSKTSGRTSASFSWDSGKTSPYDRNFEQHLIDHNIYPNNRGAKPDNWVEINRRLSQPRASLSPSRFSDGAFEKFQKINESALTEAKVMNSVFPIIIGTEATNIPSEQSLLFNNLKPLTNGGLVDAKPDFYDGTELEKINPEIRDSLGSMIIPSSLQHAPSLPNFFTEAKSPDGSAAVAKRQACYDRALGARAMASMRQFRQPPTEDHNAVTITSTFHGSTLKLYTTHITDLESNDGPKYHMSQLRSFAMTDTTETFRQGASALRNARDWAMEQRERVITTANPAVIVGCSQTSASDIPLIESDTSIEHDPQPPKPGIFGSTRHGRARREQPASRRKQIKDS